jgi:hypothetical protein
MDMQEHFYTDDPAVGPPDVRTRLADADYFFVGNGHIQTAVQVCRSGEGTPLGLLVMHPERFGPKRAALTCDPHNGLTNTVISVKVGDAILSPHPSKLHARWGDEEGIPTACVSWSAGSLKVEERFYCPDRANRRLLRQIRVESDSGIDVPISLLADRATPASERRLEFAAHQSTTAMLVYELVPFEHTYRVAVRWVPHTAPTEEAIRFWHGLAQCRSGEVDLDHLFSAARSQLPVAVDATGRMDGSIWQYNHEWVRDQAHVAEALARIGNSELAGTMLARMLDDFVSFDGDTVDSGQRRAKGEIELDQNGELLAALRTYVDWTGDIELIEARWGKVQKLALFPLRAEFLHEPSGLLHNQREYWERHEGHGIEDGFELMHQFFVSLGLSDAAYLAALIGADADQNQWTRAASKLRDAMLDDPRYRMVESGHFIKRRSVDGAWQQTITAPPHCMLPDGIPLKEAGPHFLDPDTSSVLPIAHGFIDPLGELAGETLAHIEQLWNQWWDGGGYGRYNASSEADSAGPWPFASLFVARAYTEAGNDDKVWRILRWLASKPGRVAGSWFEFDGPRIAPPYPQVGFTPWTWAELITLYVHHLLGVHPDSEGITIRPHVLDGLDQMDASLQVQGHRLDLQVRRAGSESQRGGRVGSEDLNWLDGGVRLPKLESQVEVEVVC